MGGAQETAWRVECEYGLYNEEKRREREKKKIKVEGVVFLLMTLLLLTDCHFLSMNGAGTLRQVFSLSLCCTTAVYGKRVWRVELGRYWTLLIFLLVFQVFAVAF